MKHLFVFCKFTAQGLTMIALTLSILVPATSTKAQVLQDTVIQNLLAQMRMDTLVKYVRNLSGEDSVWVSGVKTRLTSRVYNSPTYVAAGNYIEQTLRGYGLNVFNQYFNQAGYNGRNIYAIQYGTQDPAPEYIICAHWDAVTTYCADDNASGVAAVLEIARVLSKRTSPSTLIYALWDREEAGLHGSAYYANQAFTSNQNIKGVINLDMIGYDSNDDGLLEIHTRNYAQSVAQANLIKTVDSLYSISVHPVIINPGATASDHASFWNKGFSANLIIEAYYGNDFNPFYHTPNDRIQIFNLSYFFNATKLAMASLAQMAKIKPLLAIPEKDRPYSFILYGNYPNPFNPSTVIRYQLAENSQVSLKIYNTLGQEIRTLIQSAQPAGEHRVIWDGKDQIGRDVASGIYIYRLQAGQLSQSRKMTLMR